MDLVCLQLNDQNSKIILHMKFREGEALRFYATYLGTLKLNPLQYPLVDVSILIKEKVHDIRLRRG